MKPGGNHRTDNLGGTLLASVSRSFYLSIKVLPRTVRGPVSLAYLLARTADTIADTAHVAAELRLKHLDAFSGMIRQGVDLERALILQRDITPDDKAERMLLGKIEPCLDWLHSLSEPDRADIAEVLGKIIHGQRLDIERFSGNDHPQALQTAADLDEYTYLVAGCVGDFWTRICCRHLKRYSRVDVESLRGLGVEFGKGLQLVNILRDMPADLRAGRCYLPADELRAAGVEPEAVAESTDMVRPVFDQWRNKAVAHLDAGFRYIEALHGWRVRVACILPWAIGVRTLALLSKKFPLTTSERIKVPRAEVRRIMFHALIAAASNALLRDMRAPMHPAGDASQRVSKKSP